MYLTHFVIEFTPTRISIVAKCASQVIAATLANKLINVNVDEQAYYEVWRAEDWERLYGDHASVSFSIILPEGGFYDADGADWMTVDEFRRWVLDGSFTEYDGSGYYAERKGEHGAVPVVFSDLKAGIYPSWATWVAWYNKKGEG